MARLVESERPSLPGILSVIYPKGTSPGTTGDITRDHRGHHRV